MIVTADYKRPDGGLLFDLEFV